MIVLVLSALAGCAEVGAFVAVAIGLSATCLGPHCPIRLTLRLFLLVTLWATAMIFGTELLYIEIR